MGAMKTKISLEAEDERLFSDSPQDAYTKLAKISHLEWIVMRPVLDLEFFSLHSTLGRGFNTHPSSSHNR